MLVCTAARRAPLAVVYFLCDEDNSNRYLKFASEIFLAKIFSE